MKNKMIARIIAGTLAGLLVLGTITMTIMYLFSHSHFIEFGGLPM